jgi:hypothetical protein
MVKTSAVVPEEQQFILSSLSPGPAQRRLALAVVLALLVAYFITVGPLSTIQLGRIDAFVPAYATATFVIDSITAVLLFAQFYILRSRALLAISSGYLFTAFMVIPWMTSHHVSYGAAVADIEVNRRTGVIVAKRLFGALDCGQAVNPAAVEAQIMGQMIQATSRTLKEEVLFDKEGVTSLDWISYPVLRFAEHPDVVPIVVQRLDEPSSGAGEEVMGATTAAIANAFYDATGVRLRQYPMTPERVKAALASRT